MQKDHETRRFSSRLGLFTAVAPLLAATAGAAAPPDVPLPDAARRQDRAAVRGLLERGADVNARHPDGASALHWAIHWQDTEMALLLMRAGADVNAVNDYGVTPLSLACANGDAEAVLALLEARADPNLALPTGETPLMTAARTGSAAAVTALIDRGADVNARERQQQQSALMWAAAAGRPAAVRVLLEHAADPRARSTRDDTPLGFAARVGNVESAKLLLDAGADVNERVSGGLTPLIVATVRGHIPLAIYLLGRGADPNHQGPGYSALHWAAGLWETELTGPRGIAAGRDEEWRALDGAIEGKLDLVRALLAHGADPNAAIARPPPRVGFSGGFLNLVGATPFVVAASAGDAPLMRVLIEAGGNPQLTTKEGTTALMAAAGVGRRAVESSVTEERAIEAALVALEHGADVNAANEAGDTALHGGAALRWPALVKLLAEKGAALDARNKRGRTPLANAAGSDTEQLLRALGATDSGSARPQ
jgi:ankyrin repeat protein